MLTAHQALQLAAAHFGHLPEPHGTQYCVVGQVTDAANTPLFYVDVVFIPFNSQWLAKRWPLRSGAHLVCRSANGIRIVRSHGRTEPRSVLPLPVRAPLTA